MVLSLLLPEREIGVKLTYGPVGDAPMSIPAFNPTLKNVIKPLPPPWCGHIVYSHKFPEITPGAKGLSAFTDSNEFTLVLLVNCTLVAVVKMSKVLLRPTNC